MEVSVYLDASALVPLFMTDDALSDRSSAAVRNAASDLVVSDLAAAEFASVVARLVRTRDLTLKGARSALETFDAWVAERAILVELKAQDMAVCAGYLRRLDLPLRTPDALHVAMASRLGATLMTFDRQMVASAKKLGVSVVRA